MKILILLLFLTLASCVSVNVNKIVWDDENPNGVYMELKDVKFQLGLRSDGVVVWREIQK